MEMTQVEEKDHIVKVYRSAQSYLVPGFTSVSIVDEETVKQEKKATAKKNKYYADKLVVDTIIETISNEPLDLTELMTRVSEETSKSVAKCREIVNQYKGEGLDEFTFWRIRTGAHNRKTLELLTLGN